MPAVQRATTRRAMTGVAISAALVLTSCGDKSTEEADVSPLAAIFGGVESPAESRRKQLEQEELVAQCMKEAGWEYTPVDYSAQFPEGEFEDPSTPEFGEKYGYGMVHNYELYELPYLDEDGNYTEGPGQSFVDPNQEYVSSLTEDEMSDYYAALQGQPIESPPFPIEGDGDGVTIATSVVGPALEDMGCYGKASAEVYGDQPWSNEDFNERFGQLSEDMENDPRLEDAEIIWSDCMYEIDANYDFLDPNETYQYLEKLMAEAKGQKTVPFDTDAGQVIGGDGTEEVYGVSEGPDGDAYATIGQPKPIAESDLKTLQEQELTLWRSDQSCQKSSGLKELRRQLEQELADAILAEFPDLVNDES